MLILCPWIIAGFARSKPHEAALILALPASYLMLYASFENWHGLYYLGPRYLMPMVPFLLLPLAGWLDATRAKAWWVVAPLAAVGAWVQLTHYAANWSYVFYYEKYLGPGIPRFKLDFLFIPDQSPILAQSRATLAWDYRVDMWLVNVYRMSDAEHLVYLAIPLLYLFTVCLWRLRAALRAADSSSSE